MKWILIALALLSADCRRTFVLVTIESGSPAPPAVHSITLELALGSRIATNSLRESDGRAILLPTTAALEITGGGDRISANAIGFSASSTAVAWGDGAVDVRSGSETPLTLILSSSMPPLDTDGGSTPMDMASMPPPDLLPPPMCPTGTTTGCNGPLTSCTFSYSGGTPMGCAGGNCNFSMPANACVTCKTGTCDLTCNGSCTFHCAAGATCTMRCPGDSASRTISSFGTCP